MSTIAYKCPCCASPLIYDGVSARLKCGACDNEFDIGAIEAVNQPEEQSGIDFDMPEEDWQPEASGMQGYNCKSCGAELIADTTTTATECPYCGSPTILPDRIDAGVKPEIVVPFIIGKEEAQKTFEDYFQGKKLLPNIFRKDNRIAEMRKLFVPSWLFQCDAYANIIYDAERRRVERTDEWEITRTEHYIIRREGTMSFDNIPVDGSAKLDDKISESIEPYDLSKAVPFQPAVLSGAMADHADVDAQTCERRAAERVEGSITQTLRNTVSGYENVRERSKSIKSKGNKVTPALLPIWLITTQKEDKIYTFAINGQTGKLTCDVPTDKGKAFLWGAGVFAGVFALGALLLYLLKMLESGMVLMAALLALLAAVGVVFGLIGQLKQARSQTTAGNYIRKDSLAITNRHEQYLYTSTTRRKIETQQKEASA